MCGFTGFFHKKNADVKVSVEAMTETLVHRGPDSAGIYQNEFVSLGHRRLSILDLSSCGHQPMLGEGESHVLVFNGEIYNYLDIKAELQGLGHNFRSHSDTEVILKGFQQWGTAIFAKLNGIFAFALFDRGAEKLFLVRDRLGVKPLYVYDSGEKIFFSSEIKSITAVCPQLRRVNYDALSAFLYYGSALGSQTLHEGIKAAPPGSYCEITRRNAVLHTYWKREDVVERTNVSAKEAAACVQQLLDAAVKRQLISDVPVGVFLSGGIDSSAITAFAARHYGGKLKTFAAAFDFDKGVNELGKARAVADYYNTEHHEFFIQGKDLPDVIEKMVYHHDAPFSDAANIPLYLMAKEVKPFATVVLQGDGGDELFGGYNRYFLLHKYGRGAKRTLSQVIHPMLRLLGGSSAKAQRMNRIVEAFGQKNDAHLMAWLLTQDTSQSNTRQSLSEKYRKATSQKAAFQRYEEVSKRFEDKDLVQRMLFVDSQIILPDIFLEKVDKSTMAASIEARVPFLDNDLVDYALSLPSSIKVANGEKKGLLKAALRGVVPDSVLDGKKTGFGVPFENWLRGPLFPFMNDKLHSAYMRQLGLFDYKHLDRIIAEHKEGKGTYGFQLWKLMNLSIWLESNQMQFS